MIQQHGCRTYDLRIASSTTMNNMQSSRKVNDHMTSDVKLNSRYDKSCWIKRCDNEDKHVPNHFFDQPNDGIAIKHCSLRTNPLKAKHKPDDKAAA